MDLTLNPFFLTYFIISEINKSITELKGSKKNIMHKIMIYDAIMGSGKTHNAIERMKNYLENETKFIYITPFLLEIDRVTNALGSKNVFSPIGHKDGMGLIGEYYYDFLDSNGNWNLNVEPEFKTLNKRAQFLKLANEGKCIVSTHALFMSLKHSDFNLFDDYVLILDEVVNPLKIYNIGAKDIQILLNEDLILINDETKEVKFIDDEYYDKAFKEVKNLCDNSKVYYLDKYFFVWAFPIEIFNGFKEIQVLTYLFEGSILSAYFQLHNITYEIIRTSDTNQLETIKSLLNIYEGKSNGNLRLNSFSKSWLNNLSKANQKKVVNTTSYVLRQVFKTNSEENAYTTFKDFQDVLAGKGYTKGFIAINARASNSYSNKRSMAYLGNRYFDPQIKSFFYQRGIILNEDLWALSELIQWVWRGCIRNGEPMNVFIPNNRMRSLLNQWLDGNISEGIRDLDMAS